MSIEISKTEKETKKMEKIEQNIKNKLWENYKGHKVHIILEEEE